MAIDHEKFMIQALDLAREAARRNEVPVGALVVDEDDHIIGRGFNRREQQQDPTAHAEILALKDAARRLGSWRLVGTRMYVTLEPCPMCAGALVNARVPLLVYGCSDPKAGAVKTLYELCEDSRLNHRLAVIAGVLSEDCAAILKQFFANLRNNSRIE